MKKLFYIALVAIASSVAFTSCTEEEVAPQTELDNGGGEGMDGKGAK
jgi:hypothetical protein